MMVIINMKTVYGKYRSFQKEFKDENHQSNWIKLMTRKGHKIIGIHESNEKAN